MGGGGSKRLPPVPAQFDPVTNYKLPELSIFLTDPASLKCMKNTSASNANCVSFLTDHERFTADPTVELAESILGKYLVDGAASSIQCSSEAVVSLQKALQKCNPKSVPADLFQDCSEQVKVQLANYLHDNFRGSKDFVVWLSEARGTTPEKLRKEWWKPYKKTKWAHPGKKGKAAAIAKGFEIPGNAVPNPSSIAKVQPNSLLGRFALVYWPSDNLTRTCHILSYVQSSAVYKVFYFFDGKKYDEFFDSDWQIVQTDIEPGTTLQYDPNNVQSISTEGSYGANDTLGSLEKNFL